MRPATHTWRPAACSTCQDPEARLVRGDSDRTDIVLCTRCLEHGHLPYYAPQDLVKELAPTQVLACSSGFLQIGTPLPPDGLAPSTARVVDLAETKALRPGWRTGRVRHDLILSAPGPHGPAGWITVGARSGKILRGTITSATTRHAKGVQAVRALIAALPAAPCPPLCDAATVEDCLLPTRS
ncbi:hypothetical protein ACFC7A_26920 [Streptomyces niveus]|uniref:hypothetical protein n=1 Tax=Streptomyces niveus TaxID=193462 RepID=UPI0035D83BF0